MQALDVQRVIVGFIALDGMEFWSALEYLLRR